MSERFIRVAVLWFVAGIALGTYMGISQQHIDKQVHVHGNLLGWVSSALFAWMHRAWPALQSMLAAKLHFWLHNIGTLALIAGLLLLPRGHASSAVFLGIGSIALVVASVLIAWAVWRVTES